MNEQELNKKLAEWRWPNARVYIPRVSTEIRVVVDGQTTQYDLFTQSLDACFKWLVPKLYAIPGFINITFSCEDNEVFCHLNFHTGESFKEYFKIDKDPALALCLAIEKLIDKEVKV